MPPARDRERARKILRLEIGDEENDRASGDDVVQVIERQARQRAAALRLEIKNLADQTQRVRAAFLRRNEKLDLIREENEPDLVVVSDRAEGEEAGDFRRELALRLRDAAEISRSADIDHQHDRQLAFLGEFLHEGVAETRGHVPIDRANLVARLVFADVLKIHPAPFEDAVVIAREGRLDETLGLDLEGPDFLENLGRSLSRFVISSG